MDFPGEIITILKGAKKPLKSYQILILLKKAHPEITIDKKELNQIIWRDLRQKINYNNTDFTITLKGSVENVSIPNNLSGTFNGIITECTSPNEFAINSEKEIKLADILKIVAEEKLRLGTHESNLMAENITIRLKNIYGAN